MRFVLLALILTSCAPPSNITGYETRPPFEFVAIGKLDATEDELLKFAGNTCKGPFNVTQYTKTESLTVMYYICKVGK